MDGAVSRSGWGKAVLEAHAESFDLLLGRRTYDIWSGYWPTAGSGPLAVSLNAATKYVATHRPDTLKWGPVECLGPDIIADVHRIKETNGPDLILWGSSTLTSTLLENGLADEVMLLVFPVLLGKGKRFFSEDTAPRGLVLTGTKASSSGVLINTYTLGEPLRSGSGGDAAA
jgi:dihydrofolate reductase